MQPKIQFMLDVEKKHIDFFTSINKKIVKTNHSSMFTENQPQLTETSCILNTIVIQSTISSLQQLYTQFESI